MLFLTSEESFLDDKIAILYFYASWMPMHNKMINMLESAEEKFANFKFVAIDVDYFKSFLSRFNIDSIPTVIAIRNGKELLRINGLILSSALKAFLLKVEKKDKK